MITRSKTFVLGLAALISAPSIALADGYYAAFQLGDSQQVNDAKAYGSNIALDADFPRAFDAGDGTVGGVGIGYIFSEKLRLEARLAYRDSSFNEREIGTGARDGEEYILNGDVKSTSLAFNGFYDFPNKSAFTPFITAGLGVSDNSYSARLGGAGVSAFDQFDGSVDGYYDAYAGGDSTDFTWNIGLGGSVMLSDKASIYGEYQYVNFGDVKTGQDSFTDGFKIDDLASHEFVLGVRVGL